MAVAIATVPYLWRWSADDVDAVLALAGMPITIGPAGFALAAGLAAGTVTWAVLYLIWGPGGWYDARKAARRARRRPLSYADLGPPPPREQPLPTNLDQPLSAFDPDAIDFYQHHQRGR